MGLGRNLSTAVPYAALAATSSSSALSSNACLLLPPLTTNDGSLSTVLWASVRRLPLRFSFAAGK